MNTVGIRSTSMGTRYSQLAVYYAAYKHLAKMTARNIGARNGGKLILHLGTGAVLAFGGWLMYKFVRSVCRNRGLDTDKVDRIGQKTAPMIVAR